MLSRRAVRLHRDDERAELNKFIVGAVLAQIGMIPSLAADALTGLAKGKMKMNIELTGIDEPPEKKCCYTVQKTPQHPRRCCGVFR